MSAPLSDAHGYELVRVATKWKLPVDLQKLIWADVTGRYHRRHGRWGQFGLPVIEKAHVVVQTAARRMLAIIKARLNGQSIGWRWSEFVGRRLDYARSVRLPKDMRQYGYDRRAPLQCRARRSVAMSDDGMIVAVGSPGFESPTGNIFPEQGQVTVWAYSSSTQQYTARFLGDTAASGTPYIYGAYAPRLT